MAMAQMKGWGLVCVFAKHVREMARVATTMVIRDKSVFTEAKLCNECQWLVLL
jgi:hypothetical protein